MKRICLLALVLVVTLSACSCSFKGSNTASRHNEAKPTAASVPSSEGAETAKPTSRGSDSSLTSNTPVPDHGELTNSELRDLLAGNTEEWRTRGKLVSMCVAEPYQALIVREVAVKNGKKYLGPDEECLLVMANAYHIGWLTIDGKATGRFLGAGDTQEASFFIFAVKSNALDTAKEVKVNFLSQPRPQLPPQPATRV